MHLHIWSAGGVYDFSQKHVRAAVPALSDISIGSGRRRGCEIDCGFVRNDRRSPDRDSDSDIISYRSGSEFAASDQKETALVQERQGSRPSDKVYLVSQNFQVFNNRRTVQLSALYSVYLSCISYAVFLGGDNLKKEMIVVCDEDEAYVEAFTAYLLGKLGDITVCSFTKKDEFLQDDRRYALGILSREFLEVEEFSCKDNIVEKMYLCDEDIASEYEHLPMVYKYQSMDIVVEMLQRRRRKQKQRQIFGNGRRKGKLIGIFSPISHELQLPFALAVCQICQEQGSVLFLDLEEFSILPEFMGIRDEEGKTGTLLDMLYLLEGGGETEFKSYTRQYMGIDYLLPFSDPEEMSGICVEQWKNLFSAAVSEGYDAVIVLFGRVLQGFWELSALCQELLVLNKPGDYYQKSQKNFMHFAAGILDRKLLWPIQLPMSAGNLADGTYRMEELIQGNLGVYVRRQLEQMAIRGQGERYGSG